MFGVRNSYRLSKFEAFNYVTSSFESLILVWLDELPDRGFCHGRTIASQDLKVIWDR